jgi:sec-independent protein translocase protein TatA
MIGFLQGTEWIIALVIVLVLFGGSQIPKLARNLGRAQKEFQDGIEQGQKSASNVTDTTASSATEPQSDGSKPSAS